MWTFLKRKVGDPILAFLKQGVTPAKLAWAISLGIVLATMPVFGSGTLLCLLAIWLFRLNPGIVLVVNQFAYPLQFVLYFTFIRGGEWLFNAEKLPFSIPQIFEMFRADLWNAILILWWATMRGILVWIIIMIPVSLGLQIAFRVILSNIKTRQFALNSDGNPPKSQ